MYKSEGRKKFERETPQRVPIVNELTCYPTNPIPEGSAQEELILSSDSNLTSPQQNNPVTQILIAHDELGDITLVIKKSTLPDYCLTAPMNKDFFQQNKTQIIKELHSWP